MLARTFCTKKLSAPYSGDRGSRDPPDRASEGATLNSRIPGTTGFLTLPATDTYTIEATSFGAGALGTYTLALTVGSGFSVSGRVTAGGAGLVGVTLTFSRVGGGASPAAVQTDGAGAWSQTGFVPGQRYTVTPSRWRNASKSRLSINPSPLTSRAGL